MHRSGTVLGIRFPTIFSTFQRQIIILAESKNIFLFKCIESCHLGKELKYFLLPSQFSEDFFPQGLGKKSNLVIS